MKRLQEAVRKMIAFKFTFSFVRTNERAKLVQERTKDFLPEDKDKEGP